MRQGCYELLVLQSDDVPFEEFQLEGKWFVRAEAGKEYKVKFTIHREETGSYPFAQAICVLSVDGTEISGGTLLNLNPIFETHQVFFQGFRVDSDTIQVFTFNDIATNVHSTPTSTNFKAGILQVAVYEAEWTKQTVNPKCSWNSAPPTDDTVSENKKFWQQPSLATTRGRELKSSFNPVTCRTVRRLPDATVAVQCHTAGVLDYLLDQHNKLHAPSCPTGTPPVTIDLTPVPDVLSVAETVPAPPVVLVDLCDDTDVIEVEKLVKVKVEKNRNRRSNRTARKQPVALMPNGEVDGEVDVKVEKEGTGGPKKNKKKRAVGAVRAVGMGVMTRGNGGRKKARTAGEPCEEMENNG